MRFKVKNDLHRMVFFSSPRVARMSFSRNELSAVHSRDLPIRARPRSLLSVVIPARDEECCIACTIEHLRLGVAFYNL